MTLEQIKSCENVFLTPADIADVLHSCPQTIRVSAKAGVLGFPVSYVGNRLRIPRIPFLRFIGEVE